MLFRATKSTEPILKECDELFDLARILWLRQARPDNYWLLNSETVRSGKTIAKVSGRLSGLPYITESIANPRLLAFCWPHAFRPLQQNYIIWNIKRKKKDRRYVYIRLYKTPREEEYTYISCRRRSSSPVELFLPSHSICKEDVWWINSIKDQSFVLRVKSIIADHKLAGKIY